MGAKVSSTAQLKLIVTGPQTDLRPPVKNPALPRRDNDPGSVDVLLAANKWWRENPWPTPFDKTIHSVRCADARSLDHVPSGTVHLIVTSPPYFNIKPYDSDAGGKQLARIEAYEEFLDELTKCMSEWNRVLVPGGRACCVVGDVLVPRKKDGRHRILPLPADIMVRAREVGLDTLTPILWFKIGNRTNEAGGGSSGYYGKPYQPGAVIKNDFEHILMLRKPGAYRSTPMLQKALSMLQREEMDAWQRPFWSDIKGASLRNGHPAPFPSELAERLIRMFSFAGDLVLDPFCGSGSTPVASCRAGRNSLSSDIEPLYVTATVNRVRSELGNSVGYGAHIRQLIYEKA
jgi:site-specific DNA-methyltransferase (adenine-specific)